MAAKKPAAKKSTAKKSTAKKSAPKKSAAKKSTAKAKAQDEAVDEVELHDERVDVVPGEIRSALIRLNDGSVKSVLYEVVNGEAVVESDIVLGSVEEVESLSEVLKAEVRGDVQASVVISGSQFRWPNGTVHYTIDPALPSKNRVTDAIQHWEDTTNFRFVLRTSANAAQFPNFVTFRPGSGCSSSIGRRGGQQFINLAAGCGTGNTIHEIGHTIGIWHEQSREDRDSFVTINFANIIPGREANFSQRITDGDDVGGYDYGSIMHYPRKAFSKNGLDTIVPTNPPSAAIGQRTALSAGDVAAANSMAPPPAPEVEIANGVYTVRQKVNGRFMDAHESSSRDFSVVSRAAQDNTTQRWKINRVGSVYTLRQKSNGRFLDAHTSSNDFSVVTRTSQNNDTQRWVFMPLGGNAFTIQQLSTGRFIDAYTASNNFEVVTRTAQNNDTQRWTRVAATSNSFSFQQKSNGRFLDAHTSSNDFSAVTRTAQNNDTQRWIPTLVGGVYTIRQQSNNRFVDAHTSSNDFSVVTRTAQNNDTQRWVFLPVGTATYTIQQLSTRRFMDAHTSSNDFNVVTRTVQNNDSQRWKIDAV
jgi:hypothetical protein